MTNPEGNHVRALRLMRTSRSKEYTNYIDHPSIPRRNLIHLSNSQLPASTGPTKVCSPVMTSLTIADPFQYFQNSSDPGAPTSNPAAAQAWAAYYAQQQQQSQSGPQYSE